MTWDPPSVHVTRIERNPETGRLTESAVTDEVCDFCMSRNPPWAYECADFIIGPPTPYASEGGFAACDNCADLIDEGDREGLIARIDFSFEVLHGSVGRMGASKIMVEKFFEHKLSGRMPTAEVN